jgi:FkbM family methyltransferase
MADEWYADRTATVLGAVRPTPDEREAWFGGAGRFSGLVSVKTKVGTFLVRTSDANVGASLFIGAHRTEFAVVRRCVGLLGKTIKDRTFVDVGANIGTSTIAALKAGFGRGVALEPEPENFNTLRLNTVINGLDDRVTALQVAGSDRAGHAQLQVADGQSGKHRMAGKKESDLEITVRTVTLDGLVDEGVIDVDRAGLLWLDVQGHETQVLKGASRLVAGGCPILFEWQPKMMASPVTAGALHAVLDQYTSFVNVRDRSLLARPVAEFDRFVQESAEAGRRMTDILVTR